MRSRVAHQRPAGTGRLADEILQVRRTTKALLTATIADALGQRWDAGRIWRRMPSRYRRAQDGTPRRATGRRRRSGCRWWGRRARAPGARQDTTFSDRRNRRRSTTVIAAGKGRPPAICGWRSRRARPASVADGPRRPPRDPRRLRLWASGSGCPSRAHPPTEDSLCAAFAQLSSSLNRSVN